jgi:hypothetical protein
MAKVKMIFEFEATQSFIESDDWKDMVKDIQSGKAEKDLKQEGINALKIDFKVE